MSACSAPVRRWRPRRAPTSWSARAITPGCGTRCSAPATRASACVMLDPTDYPNTHPMALVCADALQKAGVNVDVAATDWGTRGAAPQQPQAAGRGRLERVLHLPERHQQFRPGQPSRPARQWRPGLVRLAARAGAGGAAHAMVRRAGPGGAEAGLRRRCSARSSRTRPTSRSAPITTPPPTAGIKGVRMGFVQFYGVEPASLPYKRKRPSRPWRAGLRSRRRGAG